MMKRPVVFDLDEVLVGFRNGYRALAAQLERPVPSLDGMWDDYSDDKLWPAIKESEDFWLNLGPIVSAQVLRSIGLLSCYRPVYLVTARPGRSAFEQTLRWARIFNLGDAQVVVSPYKAEFCKITDAEYMIDDKAGNCVATQYLAGRTHAFLLDRAWNRFPHEILGRHVVRVQTVKEFIDIINGRG